MITISEEVLKAWENQQLAPVLTTVSKDGVPNSIYATCMAFYGENKLLVADNKFVKTFANVQDGCKGNILFITDKRKAYQLKGTVTYKTEGAEYDDMKKWNRADLAGKGVAILEIEEIYSGAEKLA